VDLPVVSVRGSNIQRSLRSAVFWHLSVDRFGDSLLRQERKEKMEIQKKTPSASAKNNERRF